MCCRYGISAQMTQELRRMAFLREKGRIDDFSGDIHPSEAAPVIRADGSDLVLEPMQWGLPLKGRGSLLINARAETVLTKKTFSEGVMRRRCLLPAALFYEWDRKKDKVTFTLPGENIFFMAGFYNFYGTQPRFIIITTQANSSMTPVHDRMPLILGRRDIAAWLRDDNSMGELLAKTPPELALSRQYEQMTLF